MIKIRGIKTAPWVSAAGSTRSEYEGLSENGFSLESKPDPDGFKRTMEERRRWREKQFSRRDV